MSSGDVSAREPGGRLERDRPIADFLARALARADATQTALAATCDAASARAKEQSRAALLGAVVDALDEDGLLDDAPVGPAAPLGALYPPDHRWAGWWDDDAHPPAWPADAPLERERLLRALRRLPLRQRLLLVLRDGAGLDVASSARIAGGAPDAVAAELDAARFGFVRLLGDDVIGAGA